MVWIIADLSQKNKVQEAEKAQLMAQISVLNQQMNKTSSALDSVTNKQLSSDEKAMTYIGAIEKKLTTINNYLSKRGLRGFSFKKVKTGGDSKVAAEKIFSKYDSYLSRLVSNVSLMPMGYPRISAFTSLFGHRGNPFGFGNKEFHPGIDFKGKTGDPVKCTAAGTVEFAGKAGGYGNCVRIKHINGIMTLYGHLSKINVREGQQVSVGQLIGKVGSTGRSTAAHLHYEVRRNGKAVNPKEYLSLN
ncbi:M23 family metallopeptidase [Mucilaginibacter myungsuensis]|uniref:M23 family metallopeptidase n=2 Tax=Mucilaginibacter myungsuensis TaxID=649104 RepID=A0A929PV05_9SPHI|nr:M23 family metallopeptidase [Mucilaginibacter myungsuensis]